MPALQHIFNELHYEMTRKLAEGGMGVVYEAVQLGAGNFRKVVAVKLIREEYSAIEEFQNNFIGEARLVADLIHTNIVQTYHLGKIGGQYFMVMEYVNGVNLESFLERHRALHKPMPVDLAAFVVSRIARGLSYAHQKRDAEGRRAVFGKNEKFQTDPHWRDNVLFYEYFHGDTGEGLGASHQTGWTALIASVIDEWRK